MQHLRKNQPLLAFCKCTCTQNSKATQGWSFPRHLHIEANMYKDSHLILCFKGEKTMYLSEGLIQLTVVKAKK